MKLGHMIVPCRAIERRLCFEIPPIFSKAPGEGISGGWWGRYDPVYGGPYLPIAPQSASENKLDII